MMRSHHAAAVAASFALAVTACGGSRDAAEPTTPEPVAEPEPAPAGVEPIPAGFERGPAPHLVVAGAADAIEYYGELFGAEEIYRAPGPDGIVLHAMIRIGDSVLTISDEQPRAGSFAPGKFGGSPVGLHVYVEDADEAHDRALASGARELAPVTYQFWGDRHGAFIGPFGHTWSVATRVADVPREEIAELASRAVAGEAIEEPADAEPLPIPEGWSAVTPSLVVADVAAAASYYEEALGAEVLSITPGPDGEPFHAELRIRDQIVMLSAAPATDGEATRDPHGLGGTPVQLTYYVEDAEALFAQAKSAGGGVRLPLQEMFWGDLWSEIEDPAGHVWSIATHVEDVSPEEMQERMRDLVEGEASAAR